MSVMKDVFEYFSAIIQKASVNAVKKPYVFNH